MTIHSLETSDLLEQLYLVMVAITHKKFSAHYAWFSCGRSRNYFIYFKAPTSYSVVTIHGWLDFEGGIDTLAKGTIYMHNGHAQTYIL